VCEGFSWRATNVHTFRMGFSPFILGTNATLWKEICSVCKHDSTDLLVLWLLMIEAGNSDLAATSSN
jgi:hypothetical protein